MQLFMKLKELFHDICLQRVPYTAHDPHDHVMKSYSEYDLWIIFFWHMLEWCFISSVDSWKAQVAKLLLWVFF